METIENNGKTDERSLGSVVLVCGFQCSLVWCSGVLMAPQLGRQGHPM